MIPKIIETINEENFSALSIEPMESGYGIMCHYLKVIEEYEYIQANVKKCIKCTNAAQDIATIMLDTNTKDDANDEKKEE